MRRDALSTLDSQCKALGLPVPEYEFHFHPHRRWRFDAAWVEQKLALECDGGVWTGGRHVRGKGVVNDCEKVSEAACLGWRIIRCTPQQIAQGHAVAWVQRALEGA